MMRYARCCIWALFTHKSISIIEGNVPLRLGLAVLPAFCTSATFDGLIRTSSILYTVLFRLFS